MKILEVEEQVAAILSDEGPLGRSARRQLAHDVRKTGVTEKILTVFCLADDSLVCILPICEEILNKLPLI